MIEVVFHGELELTTTPRTLMVATLSAPLINGSEWSKATDERLLKTINSFVFIWLGGRRELAKVDLPMLADTFPHVVFSTTVWDIGLTLDQELNLSEHVNLITRSCYYQLRQLR